MASRFRVVLFVLVGALVAVVLTMTSAQGALAKVSGITPVRADNYNAKLTVHWSAVPGATYQVRWAGSSAALARATVLSATTTTATSPPLNRCI